MTAPLAAPPADSAPVRSSDPEAPVYRRGPLLARFAGEFAVIVVGVLVALAFDGWRQEREEQQILDESLAAIAAQGRSNHYTFGRLTEAALPDKIASLERLVRFLEADGAPVQDTVLLLTDLAVASSTVELWLSTDRYGSARSSGQLRLLRDGDIAESLAGAYAGVEVLMAQVRRLESDFHHVALQLLPIDFAAHVSPLRTYAPDEVKKRIAAAAAPVGGLAPFVEGVRAKRQDLLPLARAERIATESRRYGFIRIRENFQRLLVDLEPWADEPLGEFRLGRTQIPGRGPDFRRPGDIGRAELGRTYAEGRWTGAGDPVEF